MRVIQLINLHRYRGGADRVAEKTARLLAERGHQSSMLTRDSRDLGRGPAGKFRAFANGLYSAEGRRLVKKALRDHNPDIVHVHDVYPLFSPWVLRDLRKAGVAVVMTCHDYRLTCPAATHLCGREICQECLGGREYRCVLKNCRGSRAESAAYAMRSALARNRRLFTDNVHAYITPTNFVKLKLAEAGFPENQIAVIPNALEIPETAVDCSQNAYAAYAGRFSPEKGIETMLDAARIAPIELRIAGDFAPMPHLAENPPPNVRFLGEVSSESLTAHYRGARFLVFPSIWYETFGLVMAEAMSHGVPVVASNIGAVPELVEDGVTGLLFEPGNPADLAEKMRAMWENPETCARMGRAARNRVARECAEEAHYRRLMAVYEQAMKAKGGRP